MLKQIMMSAVFVSALAMPACAQENNQEKANTQSQNKAEQYAQNQQHQSTPSQVGGALAENDKDWRQTDPENTLYIKTKYGTFVVELAPEMAPKHVAQIKKLARQKFYDDITFHRVIDGFMNQTGDPRGDGTGDSNEPDIQAEFTFRRGADMPVTLVGRQMTKDGAMDVGFYKVFPVATKPISQAMLTTDGKVEAWGLHCFATTSMARGGHDVNSANSQFFLMRAEYPSLDKSYSIWGRVVHGTEYLDDIKVGTAGEDPAFVPDVMQSVRVEADLPANERIPLQIMRTNSPAFKANLESQKTEDGQYPKVCDIKIPTRLAP